MHAGGWLRSTPASFRRGREKRRKGITAGRRRDVEGGNSCHFLAKKVSRKEIAAFEPMLRESA